MNQPSAEFPAPPAGSGATLVRSDDRVVITYAPLGVMHGYKWHVVFSSAICCAGIASLFLPFSKYGLPLWTLLPISILVSGAYLLGSTINTGTRHLTITAQEPGLTVESTSVFGSSRRSWSRSSISAVHVFHRRRIAAVMAFGKTLMLPSDRGRPVALWLVAVVRKALGISPQASQRPVLPAGSRVVWEKNGATAKITMPSSRVPPGLSAFLMLYLMLELSFAAFHLQPGEKRRLSVVAISILGVGFIVAILWLCHRRRSPMTFEVSADELVVRAPFILGYRRRRWSREEIEDITAGAISRETTSILLWHRRSRWGPVYLLRGGKRQDNQWVCDTIRHEMKLHAEADAAASE